MAESLASPEERGPDIGQRLAEMVKIHSSEAFYALDDPLEAAIFSVLIELLKGRDKERNVDVDL